MADIVRQILVILAIIIISLTPSFLHNIYKQVCNKPFQEKPPPMYMSKDAVRMIDTLESKDGTKKIKVEYLKENGKWVPNRIIPKSEWEE